MYAIVTDAEGDMHRLSQVKTIEEDGDTVVVSQMLTGSNHVTKSTHFPDGAIQLVADE